MTIGCDGLMDYSCDQWDGQMDWWTEGLLAIGLYRLWQMDGLIDIYKYMYNYVYVF